MEPDHQKRNREPIIRHQLIIHMHSVPHPSTFIPKEISDNIRSLSAEAEASGQLHPEALNIIYEQNWFNLFVPTEHGGLGLLLPDGLHIQEALAWTDGSVGWTVTLCSGANYFIGFLEPEVAKEIFNDSHVCLAGSGHPSGIARKTKDGYEITGRWKYATGAPHATLFTAVCIIEEEAGKQEQAFWFHKDEVMIHKDWNTTGMIATASHSFEVKDLTVPSNRLFIIDPSYAVLPHPIYQYPFLQFAEATLAVNITGMAMCFIDLAKEITEQKKRYENKTTEAEHTLNNARSLFYEVIHTSWDQLTGNKSIQQELLNKVSDTSRSLAATARQQVNELYQYCGLIAATPSSAINRVWRNLHTASLHPLLH